MARTYAIYGTGDTVSIDFSQVLQTSVNTLRKNIAGDEFVIKWEGDIPPCLTGCTAVVYEGRNTHTHSEILAIMSTSGWTSNDII